MPGNQLSVKGCEHRAGHPDRRYPCPPRTAGHGAQPSSVCFPTVTPRCPDVCSSRVEPSPGNAPSLAGFAPAVPAAKASPDLLGQILLCGGWRRQPTDFHSGLVLVRGPKTPGFFFPGVTRISWTRSWAPLCCSALAFALGCCQSCCSLVPWLRFLCKKLLPV